MIRRKIGAALVAVAALAGVSVAMAPDAAAIYAECILYPSQVVFTDSSHTHVTGRGQQVCGGEVISHRLQVVMQVKNGDGSVSNVPGTATGWIYASGTATLNASTAKYCPNGQSRQYRIESQGSLTASNGWYSGIQYQQGSWYTLSCGL